MEPAYLPRALIVIGAGGHGRETVSLVRDVNEANPRKWDLIGVIADSPPSPGLLEALGTDWLGPTSRLSEFDAAVSVAVGDSSARRRLQSLALAAGMDPATLIHPTSSIGGDVALGSGCYIGAQSVLTTHIRLGEGVQVNVGCTISHDASLEDFVTLAPGVRLAGSVVVHEGATLFTAATVLPGIRVGRRAVVGAGAVVTSDVPPGTTVVGVPARRLVRS